MGVEHKSVTLIGAKDSAFSSDKLTEKAISFIIENVCDFMWEGDECAKKYFDESKSEVMEWFGIEDIIGSLWTGNIYYRGIEVSVGLNKKYQEEINQILQWFNIESDIDIHSGVYEF